LRSLDREKSAIVYAFSYRPEDNMEETLGERSRVIFRKFSGR